MLKVGPKAVLICCSISILALFFGKVMLSPNSFLLTKHGDGLKNYYTTAYYIKYNKGLSSSAMNYPFGEHVIYTDNQPVISYLLSAIDKNIFPINTYSIAIIHYFMFFGVVLCCIFCFLVLKKFGLPTWYSMLFALLITFLSPQMERFTGHFSLAYCFYVPMIWYLLIRFMENRNLLGGSILLILTISIFGWIHLYYLPLGSFFILAFTIVYCFQQRKTWREKSKRISLLFLIALLPIVLVKFSIFLTDGVTDRPSAPFGFTHYRAFFDSVFLPIFDPIKGLINGFYNYSSNRGESHAYVGLASFFILLFSIIRIFTKFIRKSWSGKPLPILSNQLNRYLIAGTLILLFSMAIPFKWNMEFLLELVPPLKQFRSIGRFAWIFYYVFTVYSAFVIFILLRSYSIKNKPVVAIFIFTVFVGIWSTEVYIHLNQITKRAFNINNVFQLPEENLMTLIEERGYQPSEFQAIMSFPYFAIGSEKMSIHKSNLAMQNAFLASYKTGLPIIQNHLSRTSVSQSLQLIQLLSDTLIKKELLHQLPSDKPILLLTSNEQLSKQENFLISKAKQISKGKTVNTYELSLSAFSNFQKPLNTNKLHKTKNGWTSTQNAIFIENSFEENQNSNGLTSNGTYNHPKGISNLLNTKIPNQWKEKQVEISCWMYADATVYGFPELKIIIDGKLVKTVYPQHSTNIYKGWIKVTETIALENGAQNLSLELDGNPVIVDDLLVRENEIDIYHNITDTTYKKNNYTISP